MEQTCINVQYVIPLPQAFRITITLTIVLLVPCMLYCVFCDEKMRRSQEILCILSYTHLSGGKVSRTNF